MRAAAARRRTTVAHAGGAREQSVGGVDGARWHGWHEVGRGAVAAARAGGVQAGAGAERAAAAGKSWETNEEERPAARARDIYDMWARDFS